MDVCWGWVKADTCRYWFYAVDAVTLADRAGYPVMIDGRAADNVSVVLGVWEMDSDGA